MKKIELIQSSLANTPIATNAWFYCVLLYLVVDYGRPQDLLPIGVLRPGMWVILALLFFVIKYNGIALAKSDQVRVVWYFILLLLLYVPFAHNNYLAYNTFSTMLFFMPFILSVVICVNSMARLKTFMRLYVGIMVYVSIYGWLHGGVGSGAYFSDENDLSLYINMVLPFCYFLFFVETKKWVKYLYLTGLIVGILTVVVSFSRGGFLGLLAIAVVIWLVSPKKMLSLFIVGMLAGAVYLFSGDAYKSEMSSVTDTKESTANDRLMSWASAWDMFLDNPLGVGGNNFQVRFPEYQGDRFKKEMGGRVSHSLWFTLIPELGVLGIIIYYKLLRYNIRDLRKLRTRKSNLSEDEKFLNAMSIAFIASLAGFFVSASFLSVLYYPHYWYLTAIIVACIRIYHSLGPANQFSEKTIEMTR